MQHWTQRDSIVCFCKWTLRLLSVVLAILLLLFPSLAHFYVVLPCVVLPYIVLGTLFLFFSPLDSTARGASSGSTVSTVPTVSITAASGFGLLGVLSGTIGEALTDSATTLTLRQSLKAGHRDLALANHLTVLSSMSLAFWTQSKSERSIKKQALCMLLWAGCQVFRTAALPYLATGNGTSEAGHGRFLALAAMVFLDGEGLHGTVGTVTHSSFVKFHTSSTPLYRLYFSTLYESASISFDHYMEVTYLGCLVRLVDTF